MTDTDGLPPALRDAGASTRFVYNVLRAADGWLSYEALQARTGYAQPIVSRACQRLDDAYVVERRRDPDEPRRSEVRIADDEDAGSPVGDLP